MFSHEGLVKAVQLTEEQACSDVLSYFDASVSFFLL